MGQEAELATSGQKAIKEHQRASGTSGTSGRDRHTRRNMEEFGVAQMFLFGRAEGCSFWEIPERQES